MEPLVGEGKRPTVKMCLLMAELEEAEHGDHRLVARVARPRLARRARSGLDGRRYRLRCVGRRPRPRRASSTRTAGRCRPNGPAFGRWTHCRPAESRRCASAPQVALPPVGATGAAARRLPLPKSRRIRRRPLTMPLKREPKPDAGDAAEARCEWFVRGGGLGADSPPLPNEPADGSFPAPAVALEADALRQLRRYCNERESPARLRRRGSRAAEILAMPSVQDQRHQRAGNIAAGTGGDPGRASPRHGTLHLRRADRPTVANGPARRLRPRRTRMPQ